MLEFVQMLGPRVQQHKKGKYNINRVIHVHFCILRAIVLRTFDKRRVECCIKWTNCWMPNWKHLHPIALERHVFWTATFVLMISLLHHIHLWLTHYTSHLQTSNNGREYFFNVHTFVQLCFPSGLVDFWKDWVGKLHCISLSVVSGE